MVQNNGGAELKLEEKGEHDQQQQRDQQDGTWPCMDHDIYE